MRVVIQRVIEASVKVDGKTVGKIEQGVLVLVGFTRHDDEAAMAWVVHKLAGLRIFDDAYGNMNLSLQEVDGEALVVSQFTLYA
ncbi:MAG TPA: D-tyrosyl-tRNA(Tyr) deacylase, partial [Bacteroidetes bacterium]|nr:D-tyrosyl-tRNA(Tyr) deacylase [Bacteroidota bacterium]